MHLGAELRVSIEDQVLAVRAFRECLAKLLHHPFTGRVLGDIQVDDLSAIMPNQEQAVQNPEENNRSEPRKRGRLVRRFKTINCFRRATISSPRS